MKKIITAGILILILQVVLIIGVSGQKKGFAPYSPETNLLNITADSIDRLKITDEEGLHIELKKNGSKWFIASDPPVPANSSQIDSLIKRVGEFKRGLAVATSEKAAKRFKVTKDHYGHKLSLFQQEEVATLYLGTSPGFKQLHAKTEKNDEVVTVELENYEITPKENQWIDGDLLKIDPLKIESIAFEKFILKKVDGSWRVNEKTEGEGKNTITEDTPDKLIEKLSNFTTHGFSSFKEKDNQLKTQPLLSFATEDSEGKSIQWRFFADDENNGLAKRSDLPYLLKVTKWQIDDIKKLINPPEKS